MVEVGLFRGVCSKKFHLSGPGRRLHGGEVPAGQRSEIGVVGDVLIEPIVMVGLARVPAPKPSSWVSVNNTMPC